MTAEETTTRAPSTYRIIGRAVTNRDQPIEHNDTLDYPRTLPDGRRIRTGEIACNYQGVVGLPASVLLDAGFHIYEQWLCEVRNHRIIRRVVRVLGPAYAIEESPARPH